VGNHKGHLAALGQNKRIDAQNRPAFRNLYAAQDGNRKKGDPVLSIARAGGDASTQLTRHDWNMLVMDCCEFLRNQSPTRSVAAPTNTYWSELEIVKQYAQSGRESSLRRNNRYFELIV
jgi:hypothetical protein